MTPATQPSVPVPPVKPPQPSSTPAARKPVATTGDDMVCTLCGLRACWTE